MSKEKPVILYIAQSLGKMSGVRKKVFAQCEAMEENGAVVSLFSWGVVTLPFDRKPNIQGTFFYKELSERYGENSLFDIVKRRYAVFPDMLKFVIKTRPDIVYLRYPLADPIWVLFCAFLKLKADKIIFEHNSIELEELKSQGSRLGYWLEKLCGPPMRWFADYFAAVTEEILLYEQKRALPKKVKGTVMGNGFDISSVPLRTPPVLENEIHILGLANLAFWHGYDRIIKGMAEYTGHYKIIFHLAGGAGKDEVENLRRLAVSLGLTDNVIIYEPIYGRDLDRLFDICHIAAGGLGGHRKGAWSSSELKQREYCSRGIPFFNATKDDDFTNCSFYMLLELCNAPIPIEKICSFAEQMFSDAKCTLKMREYAKQNLTWTAKIKYLFENIHFF